MNIELLNKFQSLVISFANERGVNLKKEFGTVQKFKEFVLALLFKMLVDIGLSAGGAFNMVFGSGEYESLVAKVWESHQVA